MKMKHILYGMFCASICTALSVFLQLGRTALCGGDFVPYKPLSCKEDVETVLCSAEKDFAESQVKLVSAKVEIQQAQPVLCGVKIENTGRQPVDRVELCVLLKGKHQQVMKVWKCILSVRGLYDGLPLKPNYIYRMEMGQQIQLGGMDEQTPAGGFFEVSISGVYMDQALNTSSEKGEVQEKQAYIQQYVRLLSKPVTITRQKEAEVVSMLHIANTGDRDIRKAAVSVFFKDGWGRIRAEIQWWFAKGEEGVYYHIPAITAAFPCRDYYSYPLPAYQQEWWDRVWGIGRWLRCTVAITDIVW